MPFVYSRTGFCAEDVERGIKISLVRNEPGNNSWCEVEGAREGGGKEFRVQLVVHTPTDDEVARFGPLAQVHVWNVFDNPATWDGPRGEAIRGALSVFRYGVRDDTRIINIVELKRTEAPEPARRRSAEPPTILDGWRKLRGSGAS